MAAKIAAMQKEISGVIESRPPTRRIDRGGNGDQRTKVTTGASRNRGGDPAGGFEAAVRLISETSHDLRSPLSSIAATIEVLLSGELGDVNSIQQKTLAGALHQCQYINTLIRQWVHADHLRSGLPRVCRRSICRGAIRQDVIEAIAPVLQRRGIELLWDGVEEGMNALYGDPVVLQRLLVNLIVNAEKVTREGGTLLVRVEEDFDHGVARWSVIDTGPGISSAMLNQLAGAEGNGESAADVVAESSRSSGGTGLGLMISRQLATLLLSTLSIRSQRGQGTEVSFETPLDQPAAIATSYARLREKLKGPRLVPTHVENTVADPLQPDAEQPRQTDVLSPEGLASDKRFSPDGRIELGWLGPGPRRADRVVIGQVTVDRQAGGDEIEQLDVVLQETLTPFELAVRTARRTWLLVLDADHHSVAARTNQLRAAVERQLPIPSLQFGETAIVPVRRRTLQSLLVDRMTTARLAGLSTTHTDQDTVRLGTDPLKSSPIAATRLDEELRRLSQRMRSQAQRLSRQAAALRPHLPPSTDQKTAAPEQADTKPPNTVPPPPSETELERLHFRIEPKAAELIPGPSQKPKNSERE